MVRIGHVRMRVTLPWMHVASIDRFAKEASLSDVTPLTVAGIALIVAYWAWLWAFFTHVRPRVMAALGRRLAVRVRESHDLLDAGTYDVEADQAPLRKRGTVLVADLATLLVGVVGVAAAVFIPAFVVAERGWLLPLEGWLTGRRASLATAPVTLSTSKPHATAMLTIRNEGRLPLAGCAVTTENYSARTGYVNGRTTSFDLPSGETRVLPLVIESQRPVAGEHRIAIELECDRRRIAAGAIALSVR